MMGSDAAILSSDWEPGCQPSPSALGPVWYIVVEQAWPKKGRAYRLIRWAYEIVSTALESGKERQAGRLARNALSNLAKSFGGALSKRSVSPVAGCSKPRTDAWRACRPSAPSAETARFSSRAALVLNPDP